MYNRIHKTVDVLDAIHLAAAIFEPQLAALFGVGVGALTPILAPILGIAAPFLALGSGYAGARDAISKERLKLGYAFGVVTGAGGQDWPVVKDRLWKKYPDSLYPDFGKLAQTSFNSGLAAGFLCGRQLTQNLTKLKFFWASLGSVCPEFRSQYARDLNQFGSIKSWPEQYWFDFHSKAGAVFSQLYLKD
jgi:hypothetical protein